MDDYQKILTEQKSKIHPDIRWWTNFFYHFTDVHNAAGILSDGYIFSRKKVIADNLMKYDNASHAVIEMTKEENKTYSRLYFRPLTPTQYHNEGYKPKEIQSSTLEANCPIPVFLCLDVNKAMNLDGTKFAEQGLSGNHDNIKCGVQEFRNLNFTKIYHHGIYSKEESDIKAYRHSEIINKNGFPVFDLLKAVLCRSKAEKDTLLYLLKKKSESAFEQYKNRIILMSQPNCFYYNGIFIRNISSQQKSLIIEFNEPTQRNYYAKGKNVKIKLSIQMFYKDFTGRQLSVDYGEALFDYANLTSCMMNINTIAECSFLEIKIMIDSHEMYANELYIGKEIIF